MGDLIRAVGSIRRGRFANANAKLEAQMDRLDANQAQVEGQQQAIAERRRAKLLRSRALAVAGASGAGISGDPTVENILEDIETQGELNALTAMWEGDSMARGLRVRAKATRKSGREAKRAGYLEAAASIADMATGSSGGSGGSFFSKYG